MFTILTVELVIAVWGQSTVTPDTSNEYTQINEQTQAAKSFRYPQSSILSAQLCHTAVSVFSFVTSFDVCVETGFMRTFRVHTTNVACYL
jgi:hypothetical protein